MSICTKLNELIDWYEEQERRGARAWTMKVRVRATPNTVRKFARKKRGGPYLYREREIIPTRPYQPRAHAEENRHDDRSGIEK
jgi:hypothetical protein